MNETEVRKIELYSSGDLLVGEYEVKTVDDIKRVLIAIADVAMLDDVIKFK